MYKNAKSIFDPRPSTNRSTSLKIGLIIFSDGADPSVRTYRIVDQIAQPFFKLVLQLVPTRGSLYDSILVLTLMANYSKVEARNLKAGSKYQVGSNERYDKMYHNQEEQISIAKKLTDSSLKQRDLIVDIFESAGQRTVEIVAGMDAEVKEVNIKKTCTRQKSSMIHSANLTRFVLLNLWSGRMY